MQTSPIPPSLLGVEDGESLLFNDGHIVTTNSPVMEVRSFAEVVFLLVLMTTIAALSIVGNISVIAAVFIYEELREQVSNIFIVSLAFTDLFASVLVMLPTASSIFAGKWVLGKVGCDFHCLANYSLTITSYLNLMMIGMDRTEAVLHPLHYPSRVTKPRVMFVVIFVWVFIWTWCTIPVFNDWIAYDYWEANCGINWANTACQWWVSVSVLCFFVPAFSIIIATSVIIIRSAEKSSKMMQMPSERISTDNQVDVMPKKDSETSNNKKLIKSLMVLIFTFNACVTPFVLVRVAKMAVGLGSEINESLVLRYISTFSSVSLYVASATNPFIYAIFRKDFRMAFQKLFKSISRKVYPSF